MPTSKHILLLGERISFNTAYKSLIIGEGVLHGTCLTSRPSNVQICLKGFIDGGRRQIRACGRPWKLEGLRSVRVPVGLGAAGTG